MGARGHSAIDITLTWVQGATQPLRALAVDLNASMGVDVVLTIWDDGTVRAMDVTTGRPVPNPNPYLVVPTLSHTKITSERS